MTKHVPPGQLRILTYFADAEDNGSQASRAEAAQELGYAFPSAVTKHVEALVKKGYMVADKRQKRNVRLTEIGWAAINRTPAHQGVPVIGSIAAGMPILAQENHSTYLSDISPKPGRIALEVRGDSMIGAGINDGDFAIIDTNGKVRDGQIGAFIIEEEATLKRLIRREQDIALHSENPKYEDIVVSSRRASGGFSVVGPLRFVYREVH